MHLLKYFIVFILFHVVIGHRYRHHRFRDWRTKNKHRFLYNLYNRYEHDHNNNAFDYYRYTTPYYILKGHETRNNPRPPNTVSLAEFYERFNSAKEMKKRLYERLYDLQITALSKNNEDIIKEIVNYIEENPFRKSQILETIEYFCEYSARPKRQSDDSEEEVREDLVRAFRNFYYRLKLEEMSAKKLTILTDKKKYCPVFRKWMKENGYASQTEFLELTGNLKRTTTRKPKITTKLTKKPTIKVTTKPTKKPVADSEADFDTSVDYDDDYDDLRAVESIKVNKNQTYIVKKDSAKDEPKLILKKGNMENGDRLMEENLKKKINETIVKSESITIGTKDSIGKSIPDEESVLVKEMLKFQSKKLINKAEMDVKDIFENKTQENKGADDISDQDHTVAKEIIEKLSPPETENKLEVGAAEGDRKSELETSSNPSPKNFTDDKSISNESSEKKIAVEDKPDESKALEATTIKEERTTILTQLAVVTASVYESDKSNLEAFSENVNLSTEKNYDVNPETVTAMDTTKIHQTTETNANIIETTSTSELNMDENLAEDDLIESRDIRNTTTEKQSSSEPPITISSKSVDKQSFTEKEPRSAAMSQYVIMASEDDKNPEDDLLESRNIQTSTIEESSSSEAPTTISSESIEKQTITENVQRSAPMTQYVTMANVEDKSTEDIKSAKFENTTPISSEAINLEDFENIDDNAEKKSNNEDKENNVETTIAYTTSAITIPDKEFESTTIMDQDVATKGYQTNPITDIPASITENTTLSSIQYFTTENIEDNE